MAVFKDAPSFGPRTSLKQRMDKADAWIKLTPEQKTAAIQAKYATLTFRQKDLLNKQQFFLTEVAPFLIPGTAGIKFAAKLGPRILPGIQKFFNFATKPKKTPKPVQLPPGFHKLLSSYNKPSSNVVKFPNKKPQNQQIPIQGADNIIDFKPKPRKARGGKIKRKYARGGGIRKPKW